MSSDISLDVIKLTQENLGKFVKKPQLSEKLLRKPPFRFIHDIVTAVIRNTGFFDGLFSDDELISENVKDRDAKITFLQKVIEVLNIVTESSLSVRPSKVIAGLEPEKTNELLLKLSYALQNNLSSKQAVEMVTTSKNKPTKTSVPSTKSDHVEQNHNPTKQKSETTTKTKISTPSENKTTKEKTKSERHNAGDKSTHKIKKIEPTKRTKTTENNSKTTKSNGDSKKSSKAKSEMDRRIKNTNSSIDLQSDSDINEKINLPIKLVELKDIEDSEEANSIDHDQLDKSLEIHEPTPNFESNNDLSEKASRAVSNTTNIRPQSGVSRQRTQQSALVRQQRQLTIDEPPIKLNNLETSILGDVTAEKLVENQFGENVKKDNSDVFDLSESKNEPKETIKNNIRITSSRSAKAKQEPLKSIHSLSIESKSEEKSVSSNDSENIVAARPRTSLRPPSVRPSSARPGAPRLKERNTDIIVTTAEPVLVGKVNVIVENYDNQVEDDEGSVEIMQIVSDSNISNPNNGNNKLDIVPSSHGHLVQQILETQKELANEDVPKVEIEWEWGARKEREASYREIETIRSGLQSLSRASNPLGKLMDYIQEDVEIMRQELIQWRDTRLSATTEFRQQQSLTEQQIQPLLGKLKQLEENIIEQTESIHTVKSNIHRNAMKILKLIDGDD